ncbi:MAG: DUF3294 domain-containing protein [Neisseriaceae bacterium]
MIAKHFNGVEYMQRLKKVKFSDEQAEFDKKELVTKGDLEVTKGELQKEIKDLEVKLIKEIKNSEIKLLYVYCAGFIALLGVLAKGFGWI